MPENSRDLAAGRFAWKRRMGVHEAYHQNRMNRLVHWLCIPLELLAIVGLLSLVPLGAIDLAVLMIGVTAPIYLAADLITGLLMVTFLALCWWGAGAISDIALWWSITACIALFATAFFVQLRVGHGLEGRDDTEMNLEEFGRTKNPIPLLLVFYYHLVELMFAMGYRKQLAATVEDFRADHARSFD